MLQFSIRIRANKANLKHSVKLLKYLLYLKSLLKIFHWGVLGMDLTGKSGLELTFCFVLNWSQRVSGAKILWHHIRTSAYNMQVAQYSNYFNSSVYFLLCPVVPNYKKLIISSGQVKMGSFH